MLIGKILYEMLCTKKRRLRNNMLLQYVIVASQAYFWVFTPEFDFAHGLSYAPNYTPCQLIEDIPAYAYNCKHVI